MSREGTIAEKTCVATGKYMRTGKASLALPEVQGSTLSDFCRGIAMVPPMAYHGIPSQPLQHAVR